MTGSKDPGISTRTARDLMIPLDMYPNLLETATLAEAISTFVNSRIERRGKLSLPRILLIFNDEQTLTGVVRRRDIIRGLLPDFLTHQEEPHAEAHFEVTPPVDMDLADLFKEAEHQVLSAKAATPVTEVMQTIEVSVEANDDLLQLIKQTAQTQSHILPVMEDGQVIGVVRTVELLNQIHRILAL